MAVRLVVLLWLVAVATVLLFFRRLPREPQAWAAGDESDWLCIRDCRTDALAG